MLKVHQLSKAYGLDPILQNLSFSLNAGERAGLVGPNGCGKTTLLRIVAGLETADSGAVQLMPATMRLGYLPQGLTFGAEDTIERYLQLQQGDVPALSAEVERLANALAQQAEQPSLQREFDLALARLAAADDDPGRSAAVLAALGLDALPVTTPVSNLSGGQKTRLTLAGVLLGDPQLLLLDEPTNHLDLGMLEWL